MNSEEIPGSILTPFKIWFETKASILGWQSRKLTEDLMAIIINTGRLALVTRFEYNPKENIPFHTITSPFLKFVHIALLIFVVPAAVLQLILPLMVIAEGNFDIRRGTDSIKFLYGTVNFLGAILIFNLSWFGEEVADQWNMVLLMTESFYQAKENQETLKRKKLTHAICQTLMVTFIFILALVWVVCNSLGAFRCRFHVYASILPICNDVDGTHSGGWLAIVAFISIQYFVSFYCVISFLATATLIIHIVQTANYALDILKYHTQRAEAENIDFDLDDELEWYKNYRLINILITVNYNAYGRFVYPAFFSIVILALVVGNVILLTPGSSIVAKTAGGNVSVGLILFIVLVILDATKFPTKSAALLHARKWRQNGGSSTLKKVSKCARPLRVYVNSFCFLHEEFLLEILDIVVDCTIDTLLA